MSRRHNYFKFCHNKNFFNSHTISIKVLVLQKHRLLIIGLAAVSLPSLTPATSAKVGDSSATMLVPLQVVPTAAVVTPSATLSTIIKDADVLEPRVVPADSNASLIFSFEPAFATRNILEKSPPSELAQVRISVIALSESTTLTINR